MQQKLAITGLGVVSPLGIGRAEWSGALADPEGAYARAFRGPPTVLQADVVPDALGAEVWDFNAQRYLGEKGLRNIDRLTKFLIVAAKLALEDSGLKAQGVHTAIDAQRIGVCSATAYGSLDSITEMLRVAELEDPRYVNPGRFPNTVTNTPSAYVSIWEDLQGPNTMVVDGNCGALDAVLSCESHLANGRADAFVVGGGEVLSEPLYVAFRKLKVLAEQGTRYAPGMPDSDGMRLGEGAVYVCMERLDDAVARGASITAEIAGYGNAFEPPLSEAVVVHASQTAIERAICMALDDAGTKASDIDAVCVSANGVRQFDSAELNAVASVLGPAAAVAAPKTFLGETLGAGGAFGMAAALAWFEGRPVAPLVSGNSPESPHDVLVLSVGFYGNVSAVLMRRGLGSRKAGEA